MEKETTVIDDFNFMEMINQALLLVCFWWLFSFAVLSTNFGFGDIADEFNRINEISA